MCEEPANSTGFWDPGYTYDIFLKNLKPNTRYFYSYGVEGVRNLSEECYTFLTNSSDFLSNF